MSASGWNFTVQGTPSGDAYGGDFGYTDPAPLIASGPPRELPRIAVSADMAALCFCLLMNAVALAMLALPAN